MTAGLFNLFGCNGKGDEKPVDPEMEEMLALAKSVMERPIYQELTREILDSIPDEQLEQTIFDNIYQIIGDDYTNELQNVKKLTKGQQAIFSTWIVEGEVNNGGFNQFYFNSSGQYADMAVAGFAIIGAPKFSALMKEANTIYADIKDNLEEYDDGTLESFSESYNDNPLNALDDRFYDLYKEEPLSEIKAKYIREHIKMFTKN